MLWLPKNRNVKIEHNGHAIYAETLPGANKTKKGAYVRELMDTADSLLAPGTPCTLYYQQDGARG